MLEYSLRTDEFLNQIKIFEKKIAEQKKEIEALKNEKRMMTSLFDGLGSAGIGVGVVTDDYKIQFQNGMLTKRFGDDINQRCYEKYMGRREPCIFCPKCASLESRRTEKGDVRGADGRVYEIFSIPFINAGKKPNQVIHVVVDTTGKKEAFDALIESEKNYRNLFEASGDGILLADIKTLKMVEANPAICRLLGYSREELLTKTIREIHPPELFNDVLNEFVLQAEGKKLVAHKIPCITKSGDIVYADISTTKARIMGRECNVGVFRDITENLKIEQQLQRSQQMEAIGTLAGGIAHDFNNIIGIITGNASLAMNLLSGDRKSQDLMRQILSGTSQAQHLTKQLLTFARGGAPIKKAVDVKRLVEETAAFVLRGSRSTLEMAFDNNLWSADADLGQMGQVVSNLVINASQAMPSGGMISIHGENASEEDLPAILKKGRYIKMTMRDHGTGIPEKYIGKIFEPYFSTKQNGSGLGLATVYSIVTKHGGCISAESVMGEGSLFYIYWPASALTAGEHIPDEVSLPKGPGKILVMDDQEDLLNVAEGLLTHMGYDVELAKNGGEAIEIYRDHFQKNIPFDLVILDLTVPGGMGGAETMPELLKIHPGLKAVVSSGYSHDPVMANFSEYGFSAILPKPYVMDQMANIVNTLLEENIKPD